MTDVERVALAQCGRYRKKTCKTACLACRSDATAAISAHKAAMTEAGLVVVPREPTEAMIKAGAGIMDPCWGYTNADVALGWAENGWRAMIKAHDNDTL